MGRHKLFYHDAKTVRDALNHAVDLAEEIHLKEKLLIEQLSAIDQQRFYVRYGFNSLTGFCHHGLKFTKMQTQRIVILVRRTSAKSSSIHEVDHRHGVPMDNFMDESLSDYQSESDR